MENFNKKYGIPFVLLLVFFMFYNPAICFLMAGIAALLYAVYTIQFVHELNKNGIESTGKIVSYESDNEGYKTPIIEFTIDEGKTFAGKPYLHASSDLDKFKTYNENINKTIKIIYNSKSPEKFILKDNSNGCVIFLVIIIGLVFTYLSVGNLMGYNNIF